MFIAEFKKSQIISILAFITAAGWLSAQSASLLETPGLTKMDDQIQRKSHLAADGSLLIVDNEHVYHCNAEGALIRRLEIPAEDRLLPLSAAHYNVVTRQYWLVASGIGSFFLDENGKEMGRGYRLGKGGEFLDVAPKVFMETNKALFVVGFDELDLWSEPNPQVISEVEVSTGKDGAIILSKVGPSFHILPDISKSFNFNFKRHWLLAGPYHDDLFVVSELSCVVHHFVQHPQVLGHRLEMSNKRIPLALPKYVQPPVGWSTRIKTDDDHKRWWFSWSFLTGFFDVGSNFLVTYTIPHETDPFQSRRLAQVVDHSGKAIGPAKALEGHPVGMRGRGLVTLRQEENGLAQEVISF